MTYFPRSNSWSLMGLTLSLGAESDTLASVPPHWFNPRHRVLGEVEKKSFIALPSKRGPQWANVLKIMCSDLEGLVRSFIETAQEGVISSWIFFWLVGGEVMRSQHHQPSGSNLSGISMLVGGIQLTFYTWGVVSVSAKQLKGYGSEYYL